MPQTMMTALEDTAANMINSERENVRWNSKLCTNESPSIVSPRLDSSQTIKKLLANFTFFLHFSFCFLQA
jgi:hypothetical protein